MVHGHRVLFVVLVAVALMVAPIAPGAQHSLAVAGILYVDADATGANNGHSWNNAFTDLQDALDNAGPATQIWVAEGAYRPTREFSPGDPRSASFQMKNGVAIYGGFDPDARAAKFEDRDWVKYETILSGDLNGDDGLDFTNDGENSYHVFYHPQDSALDGSAILDGFTINGGNASGQAPHHYGGGMYNEGSSPALTNCTFSGNRAYDGGGMYNRDGSSPALTNCTFAGNSAGAGGGGIYNNGSASPALTNCTFKGNSASINGGGMFNVASSAPVLTNCTFWGNSANYGGGVYNINQSRPVLTNCTFSFNSAVNYGGGMYSYYYSSPTLTNCILWGDTSPEIQSDYASTTVVTYSDVQGGYTGTGNIASDPLFLDAANGDVHLRLGSPCIDAGNNNAPNLPQTDFEGDLRILDGNGDGTTVVDMGVDEVRYEAPTGQAVIYVDVEASGANNGASWKNAFINLQDAMNKALYGDQIWVAEGTYKPTAEHGGTGDRYKSFQMKNGIAIYGGFDPDTGATKFKDRDWVKYETILSGDLNGDDGPEFANNGENSYHVFYHPGGLDGTAILDGFTISGGNANLSYTSHVRGGGMYNVGSSPTLTNCTFSGNSASAGGGMYNQGSTPMLTNCSFEGNYSAGNGGGMYNYSSSSPALINCTFAGNSAEQYGGGMYNYSSSPAVTNCSFWGNSAGAQGGRGGGMHNDWNSSPVLTNCTFWGNSAIYSGGGVYSYSSFTLTNCILWDNTPDQLAASYNYLPVVTYSDVQGGYTGTGNINAAPMFVDAANGDYHLGPLSACLDAGNNAAPNLPEVDFEGDARVLDGNLDGTAIVDMGVDEACFDTPPPPALLFVDEEATGANSGTSWQDAFTDLQDALSWAVDGVEIWVAEGTYKPSWEFASGDPRSASFQMKNGVAVYGGFDPSVGVIDFGDRDWAKYETILSGDLNGDDGPQFANNGENSYHVFYHPSDVGLNTRAILDGFTITGGNANGASPHYHGGGMYNEGSSPTLTHCTFAGNSALDSGGGMWNSSSSSPVLAACAFEGNSADYGGAMNNSSSSPVLINCTFSGNSARAGSGGGMYNWDASPVLTNCTFFGNSAYSDGGGLFNHYNSAPALTNCILWGNSPGQISNDSSSPAVTYSDVQGGYDGEGNIDADPLFADAANVDFHLTSSSPCIDAGNNNAASLPGVDFEGDPRILDGNGDGTAVIDMGVDEYPPPAVIFVDVEASGANSGTSWDDAFTTLQPALNWAVDGVEIWVAAGTYKPTSGTDRTASFQMKKGVVVYGGFDPTLGDVAFEDRDWEANLTILSGDLNSDDGPDFANNGENSYHVFYHPSGTPLDGSAILDGFTISGGNASEYPHENGGGMYNYGSSPTLSNVTFSGNSAGYHGGGMYNEYSSPVLTNVTFADNSGYAGGGMVNYFSTPTLTDCTVSGNHGSVYGGGMYNDHSSPSLVNCAFSDNSTYNYGGGMYNVGSSPTLTNCTFSGNSSDYEGGGMSNFYSSPVLTECTFEGNSAGNGGGVYNTQYSSATFTNCTFVDNSADSGGGMYNSSYSSSPTLTDCTFVGNWANIGGGMYNYDGASPVLTNCTFSGNRAYQGGGMYTYSSSPTLTKCTFAGNSAEYSGGAMANYSSSPALTDCTFSGNSAGYSGGGVHNISSSPTLTNCTFAGNSASSEGGGMYNSEGSSPALTNCTFSGNSAGSEGGGIYSYNSSAATLINSILWGDSPNEIYNSDLFLSPLVTYSDVQGGYEGEGNIDADPLFADAANGDFHLGLGSPCVDAGSNAASHLPGYDFEGDPRILDGNGDGSAIVDLGVDEVVYNGASVVEVAIDIRPTGDQESIKCGSEGESSVAILTASKFEASTVDPATVRFARAAPVSWAMKDVDRDGDLDLLLNFKIRDLALDASSTEATLTGETFPHFGGLLIEGTDGVRIVP